MTDKFKNEKLIYKLLTLAVLAAAVFFVYRMIYAGVIALPYPKELLEPSNIALTNEFLAGQSPYSNAALLRDVPGVNYDYPFLNSLIAAAIAKVTGCTAVTAHFVISLISILASGIIGFKLVGRYSETTVSPILAALLFMFCHWRFGYISAAPDDLGLLMLLLTTEAAVSPRERNKPLICAIGLTLCFYTKQYFVFAAAGLFIFMLLYSVKDAIKLFVWSLVINAAVAAVITIYWPLYWTKAFLFTYIGTAVGGGGKIATFIEQFKYIAVLFAALFIIVLVAAAKAIKKLYENNRTLKNIKVNENDAFALSVVQTIVMLVPLFYIGRNDGALLSYFLQLWMPFVTVVALVSFERMKPEKHEYVYAAVYAAIAAFTIYLGFGKLPLHVLTEDEIATWQKALQYTENYSEKGDILYSRELAYDGMSRNNGEMFCGHDGEVKERTIETLINAGVPEEYLRDAKQIVDKNRIYRETVTQKAKEHRYSLILFDNSEAYSPFDEETCEEYGYRCIDRLSLQLGNMPYETAFYITR